MNTDHQDLSFLQRCTAVKVSFGNLPTSKKLPKDAVETKEGINEATGEVTKTDPKRVTSNKKLWQCNEAEAIRSEFTRLGAFIRSKTLPTPFGTGIYFVPNTLIGEVDAELTIAKERTLPSLTAALITAYDDILRREEEALGPNFHRPDYESQSEVRERLRIDFFYLTFGIPEGLPDVIRMREAEKQGQRLSEAVDSMQMLLRAEFDKLIAHAAEKLSGKKDNGKPLTFKNTTITNIQEFLQVFRDRNITGDTQLEDLCNRAKDLLNGVDPKDLREKEPLRNSLATGFAAIREQLDGMMTARGIRNIILDDETDMEPVSAAA